MVVCESTEADYIYIDEFVSVCTSLCEVYLEMLNNSLYEN